MNNIMFNNRRQFLKLTSAIAGGLILPNTKLYADSMIIKAIPKTGEKSPS